MVELEHRGSKITNSASTSSVVGRLESELCGGQIDAEGGTSTGLGGDVNKSAMVSSDAPHGCQPQTSAFFRRFGSEKRFEDFIQDFGWHAVAGIGDRNSDELTRDGLRLPARGVILQIGLLCR